MQTINPPVIYYHSIAPDYFKGWVLDWLTMKLRFFEDQMAYLQKNEFTSIFLDEWFEYRQGRKQSKEKQVCLTIDDGLLDNWVYAYPMAKKYGQKLTMFVSPECVDPRDIVRPTLEDVWAGNCKEEELEARGYMSWNEIKAMQESGFVDIQSHTMTHAKFVKSTQLKSFYYGGYLGLHPILNANPAMKPYYMADPNFESRLPYGYPLFEESSSVVTRRHFINPDFIQEIVNLADKYKVEDVSQRVAFEKAARKIHKAYIEVENLIAFIESEDEFKKRMRYEVIDSKTIIEEKLDKPVRFMCWPHGDNSMEAHRLALANGYLATTSGKMLNESGKKDRIPRFGASTSKDHLWLSRQKFNYKICSHFQKQPYYAIWLANEMKNKVLNKS